MAHWFDDLARPQTRRTALRSAGIAGVALMLPIGRASTARADLEDPCFTPCSELASVARESADGACVSHFGFAGYGEAVPIIGGLRALLRRERFLSCKAKANTQFNQARGRCFTPDCGDPETYPNGSAPTPQHVNAPGCGDDAVYVICGDQPCCNLSYASCVGCSTGAVCCRNGGNCCG